MNQSLTIQAFIKIFTMSPDQSKDPLLPLNKLQLFFMEHDHMIQDILPKLSFHLMKYIYTYSNEKFTYGEEVYK